MPPTTIKEVDERYAQEVASINQKLDKFDRFQLEMTARMAAIDTNLRWIKAIGAFVGAAILAFVGSVFYISNRAGHLEEAVSTLQSETKTLQGDAKRIEGAVLALQGDSTRNAEAVSALQSGAKRLEQSLSALEANSKSQESQVAKMLSVLESIEKRMAM
jgi:chromosome segregation ATPase